MLYVSGIFEQLIKRSRSTARTFTLPSPSWSPRTRPRRSVLKGGYESGNPPTARWTWPSQGSITNSIRTLSHSGLAFVDLLHRFHCNQIKRPSSIVHFKSFFINNDFRWHGLSNYGVRVGISWANWNQGEPNNVHYDELCVEIYAEIWTWNDVRCSHHRGYVCESGTGTGNACPPATSGETSTKAAEVTPTTEAGLKTTESTTESSENGAPVRLDFSYYMDEVDLSIR